MTRPGPLEPPTRAAHRPRVISLQVEQFADGSLRLSTPHARGWAAVVHDPVQLARGIGHAFLETSVAAYSRARGQAYDLDALTSQQAGDPLASLPPQRVRSRNPSRRAPHSPAAWEKVMVDQSGVMWRSPGGRLYRENTQAVRRVIAKRVTMGLST